MSRPHPRPPAQRRDPIPPADGQPANVPAATPEPDTAPSYGSPEAAAALRASATRAVQARFGFDLTNRPRVEIDPELRDPEEEELEE